MFYDGIKSYLKRYKEKSKTIFEGSYIPPELMQAIEIFSA
jgi:hypothetical protein